MSNTGSPSYRAKYNKREIRTFPNCVMDYLQDAAATISDLAIKFQCPARDIEQTIKPLIDSGLVEQCGKVDKGNRQMTELYGMKRTKRSGV